MPTIKIADPIKVCMDPQHYAPNMMVYEPGTWQHTCPACGHSYTFIVPQVWLSTSPGTIVKYSISNTSNPLDPLHRDSTNIVYEKAAEDIFPDKAVDRFRGYGGHYGTP